MNFSILKLVYGKLKTKVNAFERILNKLKLSKLKQIKKG